ncbi:MAG: ribbon-helix-helix protein, CopG family [Promethearchaeota archaeon]|nr:MAG: ribbon-helix-helix protein, CopG family [Candidatus Lokiarchaeota archaeon]
MQLNQNLSCFLWKKFKNAVRKKMTDVVSTRLDEKEIEELNEISDKERIDRSALIRKFLLAQIAEYRMKEVSEKYRKGLVSLAEAATLAKVSIYDMMEYIEREKIQAPALPEEEMDNELKKANKMFEDIKK